MIRSLKWIRDLLFQNIAWKLLSLVIAVVIWALVATEPELSTLTNARVEYKNIPQGLEISAEPSATSIELELSGPSGALRGVGDTLHPEVVIDMSDATVGEHTYSVGVRNVKLSRGVRLVHARPSQVRFRFEHRRMNIVPVHVRFTGEGQNGYLAEHFQIDPPEMEITGPRSRVAGIATVDTDPVDLSNATGTAQFHVNVFAADPFVRFVNSPEAVVTVIMKKK